MAILTPLQRDVPLKPYTTLRAGGEAEYFAACFEADEFADVVARAQRDAIHTTILGWGSNVLPSDDGVPGLVLLNRCTRIQIEDGVVTAETGCGFQELFLKTAQAGLAGLEFAVGIPGTLGGALVSNAGAYRSNVSEFLTEIEIVFEGTRRWVSPDWMQFSYRDSVLRRESHVQAALVRVRLKLPVGEPKAIYDEAREYQRQRISKQPPSASAGSFFKNVNDARLADSLDTLPEPLKKSGVIPAGYLLEKSGMKGYRHGGAMFGERHANFILNVGNASAGTIRELAAIGKTAVRERYGVELEEEVLYLGDWGRWLRLHPN